MHVGLDDLIDRGVHEGEVVLDAPRRRDERREHVRAGQYFEAVLPEFEIPDDPWMQEAHQV